MCWSACAPDVNARGVFPNRGQYACLLDINLCAGALALPQIDISKQNGTQEACFLTGGSVPACVSVSIVVALRLIGGN